MKPRSLAPTDKRKLIFGRNDSLDVLAGHLDSIESSKMPSKRFEIDKDSIDDECPLEERVEVKSQSHNFTTPSALTETDRQASLTAMAESLIPFTADFKSEKKGDTDLLIDLGEEKEDLIQTQLEDDKKEERVRRTQRLVSLKSQTFEEDPEEPLEDLLSKSNTGKLKEGPQVNLKPPMDDLRVSADFASHEGASSDTMGEISEDQLDDEDDDFMEMEEKAEDEEMDEIEKVEDLRGKDVHLPIFAYDGAYGRTNFGASLEDDEELEEDIDEQLWARSPRGYYPKFTNPSGLMSIEEDEEEDVVRDDKSTSTDSLELPETSVDESVSSLSKKATSTGEVRPQPRWLNFSREKRKGDAKDSGDSGMNMSQESSQSGNNSLSAENSQHEEVVGEIQTEAQAGPVIREEEPDTILTLPQQVIEASDKEEEPQLTASASPGPVLSAPFNFGAKTKAMRPEKEEEKKASDGILIFTKPPIELPNIEAIRSSAFPSTSTSFVPRPRPASYLSKDAILEPAGAPPKKPQELSFQEKLRMFGGGSQDEKNSRDRPAPSESAEKRRNLFSKRDPSHGSVENLATSLDSSLSRGKDERSAPRPWERHRATEDDNVRGSPDVSKSLRAFSQDSNAFDSLDSPRGASVKRLKMPSIFSENQEPLKAPSSSRDAPVKRLQTPGVFAERSESPKAPEIPVRKLQSPGVFAERSESPKTPESPRDISVRKLQTPGVFAERSESPKAPEIPVRKFQTPGVFAERSESPKAPEIPVRKLQTPGVFAERSESPKTPESPRGASVRKLQTPGVFAERSESPKTPESPRGASIRKIQTPEIFDEKPEFTKASESRLATYPKDFRSPLDPKEAMSQRIASFEASKGKAPPPVPLRRRQLPQEPDSKPEEEERGSILNRRSLPAGFHSESPSYVPELSKKFALVNEDPTFPKKDFFRQNSLEEIEEARKVPRPSWSNKEPALKSASPKTIENDFARAASPARPGRGHRFKAYIARINSEEEEEEEAAAAEAAQREKEEQRTAQLIASLPAETLNEHVDTSSTVRPSNMRQLSVTNEEQDFERVFANATEEDLLKLSTALGMDVETARAIVDTAKPETPDPERELYRRLEHVDGLSEEELLQVGVMMGMDGDTAKMVAKYVAMQNRKEPVEASQEEARTPRPTGAAGQSAGIEVLNRDSPALNMPEENEYGFMYIRPLTRTTPTIEMVAAPSREPAALSEQQVAMMDQFAGLGELSTTNTPGTSARLSPASSVNSDYVRLMSQFDRLGAMSVDDSVSERDTLSVISENDMADPSRRLGGPRPRFTSHQSAFDDLGALSAPEDEEEDLRRTGSSLRRTNSDRPSRAKQLDRIRTLIERKRKISDGGTPRNHVPFV